MREELRRGRLHPDGAQDLDLGGLGVGRCQKSDERESKPYGERDTRSHAFLPGTREQGNPGRLSFPYFARASRIRASADP